MKIIETKGIGYLEILSEGSDWYCGTDYASGELYEAEEQYRAKGKLNPNRVVFVHHPDGRVYEPVVLSEDQYFGRPVQIAERIYLFYVDFKENKIRILDAGKDLSFISVIKEIPLSEIEDCYNLKLAGDPLMLIRQGGDQTFQIVWPEKVCFPISERDAFIVRDHEKLIFTRWFEDPDYREEVYIRSFPGGELTKTIKGSLFISPSKELWVMQ